MYIGCPTLVRMDCGTENVKVAAVQYAFRALGTDSFAGNKSYIYGSSPSNVVLYHVDIYCIHA